MEAGNAGIFHSVRLRNRDRPERGGSGHSSKRAAGPTFGHGMVSVERAVYAGGSDFQHQMSAPQRPAHLLLGIHSPMQQPLHRALCDRRGNRFFASAGCRIVDDDVGLAGHISFEIAQQARHLACRGGNWRLIVGCNAHCDDGFGNEIQSAFDLTMPETPSDPLDISVKRAPAWRSLSVVSGQLVAAWATC